MPLFVQTWLNHLQSHDGSHLDPTPINHIVHLKLSIHRPIAYQLQPYNDEESHLNSICHKHGKLRRVFLYWRTLTSPFLLPHQLSHYYVKYKAMPETIVFLTLEQDRPDLKDGKPVAIALAHYESHLHHSWFFYPSSPK